MPDNITEAFNIPRSGLRKIIRDFRIEMASGLAGKTSSLKMLPTYVDKPSGNELGRVLALDLGGTNLRLLELKLKGEGLIIRGKEKKFVLRNSVINTSADALFGFIAECIKKFVVGSKIDLRQGINLGFTFSFPVKQTAVDSGILIHWTKGFRAKGVVGRDVVKLLAEALAKRKVVGVKITALVNDTVGTLACRSYGDKDCDIGVILGTGTNACYREKISKISQPVGNYNIGGHRIINIEWGNFNKLPRTQYDFKLDNLSINKSAQALEKMVSGMYLGKICGLILEDLFKTKIKDFKTGYMSEIEADASGGLRRTGQRLRNLGIKNSTWEKRKIAKRICQVVTRRAARISAAALAAVVTKIDASLSQRHTVAMDGTVYEKHPYFAHYMKSALREIFGSKSSRIKIALTKDGSGKGAAIIAAAAILND